MDGTALQAFLATARSRPEHRVVYYSRYGHKEVLEMMARLAGHIPNPDILITSAGTKVGLLDVCEPG